MRAKHLFTFKCRKIPYLAIGYKMFSDWCIKEEIPIWASIIISNPAILKYVAYIYRAHEYETSKRNCTSLDVAHIIEFIQLFPLPHSFNGIAYRAYATYSCIVGGYKMYVVFGKWVMASGHICAVWERAQCGNLSNAIVAVLCNCTAHMLTLRKSIPC